MGAGICGPSRTTPGTIETNEPPLPQKVDQKTAGSSKSSKKHAKCEKLREVSSNEISNPSHPVNGQTSIDDSKKHVVSPAKKGSLPSMKDNSRPSSKESNKSRRSGVIQVRPASKEHIKRQSRVNSFEHDPPMKQPNGSVDSRTINDATPPVEIAPPVRRMTAGKEDEGEKCRRPSSVDRELGIINYSSQGSDSPFNSDHNEGSEMAWSADEESVDIPEIPTIKSVSNPPAGFSADEAQNNQASKNGDIQRSDYKIIKRPESRRKLRRQDDSHDEETLAKVNLKVDKLPVSSSAEAVEEAALRLRSLVLRLEKDDISQTDIRNNLKFAATVLDNFKTGDPKRFSYQEEDDDLSEVATEDVPEQVRHWLTSTFSRQSTKSKLGDEKPRFRSIVQALRTGLFIDRMFRRASGLSGPSLPPRLIEIFKGIDDWSFDIFKLNEESDGHALKCTANELFTLRYDLVSKFKIPSQALSNFLDAMEVGYSKHGNPYHNLLHAADVTQTVHHMLAKMGLVHWLTDLQIFASLLAAIIHDFEHTGTTNLFHVNTKSELAMIYNDRSVLENHHLSRAFRIIQEEDKNILQNLGKEEFNELRNLVVDMVLATDMSFHFQQIKHIKSNVNSQDSVDKSKALALAIHCADISHPAKEWRLHNKWTRLLMNEFFKQGDREKELGLPFSPLCDRNSTMIAESQIGFIDFIVEPSMVVCCDMVDKILKELPPQDSSDGFKGSKRNSIPLARPSSMSNTPRTASVPAYEGNKATSLPDRPPSSPARISLTRTPQIPIRCPRVWIDTLKYNKGKWKQVAATEVRGQLNLQSPLLEEDEGTSSRPGSKVQKTLQDGASNEQRNATQGATGGSDLINELRIDEDVTPSTQTDINSANQTATATPLNATSKS
ncbi:dual specificity calcium/calmodulin-dependent 3',5'-cyclic nucleotide phosphodiesterase 1A-like isoform X2 [Amphiura filiformis]|uniref:dual specificity calcium/calmodulin-dependent 3',5'-cyclic nucleotide phosphodiesterase 1A-like isoform X2 n=1 Tax=Amphiura filiformis TaxID=82378 RepID=UPI003B224D33